MQEIHLTRNRRGMDLDRDTIRVSLHTGDEVQQVTDSVQADTRETPVFRYAYGRATARDVNFSVMSRKVDLSRSIDRGRWQFAGAVKQAFQATVEQRSAMAVMGSYCIGWAHPVDREIVHMRVQTVRTGHAARIAECAIVLDMRGPRFELLAGIPTTAEFPQNEIMVFSGRGWTMGPNMLDTFGLLALLDHGDEELFWEGKEDDEDYPYDSGVLTYMEQTPATADRPNVVVSKDRDGNTQASVVSSTRRRRRIKVRK